VNLGSGSEKKLLGFLSFDDDSNPSPSEELVLAHISTLVNGTHIVEDTGLRISNAPILAYALVLQKKGEASDEYRRVGIAEVNVEWMKEGEKSAIRIV